MASLLVKSDGKRAALFRNSTHKQRVDAKAKKQDLGNFGGQQQGGSLTAYINEEKYELSENDMLESVLTKNKKAMVKKYNLKPGSFKDNF